MSNTEMVYRFRKGSQVPSGLDPQKVGSELDKLAVKHGVLIPTVVVKAASRKSSSLHNAFEWDDTKAATAHRKHQARQLIASVEIVNSDESTEPRFINVQIQPGSPRATGNRGYTTVGAAMQDEGLRRQVLSRAREDMATFRAKYALLAELAKVLGAIDETLATMEEVA